MNKKGFTLVELLAVIGVIIILALLLTPKITKILDNNRTKGYEEIETRIEEAAQKYILENYIDPSETSINISIEDLIAKNYIGEVKDLKDNSNCTGYVTLDNLNTAYTAKAYLNCSKYQTPGVEVPEEIQ